jgi:hypothetical protein
MTIIIKGITQKREVLIFRLIKIIIINNMSVKLGLGDKFVFTFIIFMNILLKVHCRNTDLKY